MRNTVMVMALIVGGGCGDDGAAPGDASGDAPPTDAPIDPYVTIGEFPVTPNYDVDLLFVIDDSPSMLDKQANLAANFPNFINILANATPNGLPNLHLGVVTSDVGTLSTSSATPGPAIGQVGVGGCASTGKDGDLQTFGAQVNGTFVSDIRNPDSSRTRNYTGTLAEVFSTMARAGAGGCGFEQPLHAMRRALDNNPQNAGFLRAGAQLAVVFVTDEDDCTIKNTAMLGPESATLGALQSFRCTRFGVTCASGGATSDEMNAPGGKSGCTAATGSMYLDDVAPYRDFLLGLKAGDATKVAVAAIMGPTEPFAVELRAPPGGGTPLPAIAHACAYQGAMGPEVADPPVRLKTLLDLLPGRTARSTVCQQDLSGPLAQIASLLAQAAGSTCLGVDPGPPADCLVDDLVGANSTSIPACTGGIMPCWQIETDAVACPAAPSLKLVVMRDATPDPATVTRLRCKR